MTKKISVRKADDIEPTILSDGTVYSRRVITQKFDNSNRMSFHHVVIKRRPDWKKTISDGIHDEILYVVDGEMGLRYNGKEMQLFPGTCVYLPFMCEYESFFPAETILVCAFSPPKL